MQEPLAFLFSGPKFDHYRGYYQGMTVRILHDRATEELWFDTYSIARLMGFQNVASMLDHSDEVKNAFLDEINDGTIITGAES
ncbi:MAG TPA: hypothetical protein VF581_10415 [Flavobacterium sp.]|jgi:hypothetical protein